MPRLSSALRHHSSCTLVMMTWKWSGIACRMCTGPWLCHMPIAPPLLPLHVQTDEQPIVSWDLDVKKTAFQLEAMAYLQLMGTSCWHSPRASQSHFQPSSSHLTPCCPANSPWTTSSQGSWMRRCDKHWPVLAQMPAQTHNCPKVRVRHGPPDHVRGKCLVLEITCYWCGSRVTTSQTAPHQRPMQPQQQMVKGRMERGELEEVHWHHDTWGGVLEIQAPGVNRIWACGMWVCGDKSKGNIWPCSS